MKQLEEATAVRAGGKRKRNFIKVGNVRIPWYRAADGRTFIDPRAFKRPLFARTDHESALLEARRIAIELNEGGAEVHALTSADRAAYAQTSAEASRRGVDLIVAMSQWGECTDLLNMEPAATRPTLQEAVRAGLAALRKPAHFLPDVVAEFLAIKALQEMDGRFRRDLQKQLGSFATHFAVDIAKIDAAAIERWLDQRKKKDGAALSLKRRRHVRANVVSLFKFARERGYLPDEKKTEAQKVFQEKQRVRIMCGVFSPEETIKLRAEGLRVVGIFLPAEIQFLLRHAPDEDLPWLAINAFSGARIEEIAESRHARKDKDWLRWEDFKWRDREILIRAEVSKTGSPRRMPILDNVWNWLAPYRDAKLSGRVVPGIIDVARERVKRHLLRLSRTIDHMPARILSWPENGLRHSYASYRLGLIDNFAKLAIEMGNSVSMLQQHYVNPQSRETGEAWFNVSPEGVEKIIQMGLPGLTAERRRA